MRSVRTIGAVLGAMALAAVGVGLTPGMASAEGPAVESCTYADTIYDCGYPIEMTGEFRSAAMSRSRGPQDPTTFFDHQRYSWREVWSNPANGRWFVVRGSSVNLDIKATQVEDNVFEYTTIKAGMSFVVEDSSGRVVARDRGEIRFRLLFDTRGDADPEREFVDFLGLSLGGPHPTFDVDTCRYAGDLIVWKHLVTALRAAPDGFHRVPLGSPPTCARRTAAGTEPGSWSTCTVQASGRDRLTACR